MGDCLSIAGTRPETCALTGNTGEAGKAVIPTMWESCLVRLKGLLAKLLAASLALILAACISGPAEHDSAHLGGAKSGLAVAATNSTLTDPPYFVYDSAGGVSELRSPLNGTVVEVLGKFGDSLTSNGLAESANGQDVYVTLIGKSDIDVEQISTATRKKTIIASGMEPAISPNRRFLAYASGPKYRDILAVRNLTSGKTTSVGLLNLLGSSTNLGSATITWLGDGTDIVIDPAEDATGTSSGSTDSTSGAAHSCSAVSDKATCLIVVHFDSTNGTFASRRIVIPQLGGTFGVISAAGNESHSLVLATWGETTNLYDITLSGSTAHVTHLVAMSMVLPVAFDLLGTHIFYIVGHGPTALWVAKIASGRLVQAHRLIASADVSDIAW
jgi:hypothetical protein